MKMVKLKGIFWLIFKRIASKRQRNATETEAKDFLEEEGGH